MQLAHTKRTALAVARLLSQLPGKDLASADAQAWLCGELARLCGARCAALYWPAVEGRAWEFWGDLPGRGTSEPPEQIWFETARQAFCTGQPAWVEEKKPGGGPRDLEGEWSPGWIVCLPFHAERQGTGVFLLWTGEPDLQNEVQELLPVLGGGIAGQREQALLLKKIRADCAELEQRRAELLHSRDTLRALFDNTPTSMYIVGADYTLQAVNSCRADLAGQRPQRLVGRHCFNALFERVSPCPDCLVEESLAAGRSTRRIARRTCSGGPSAVLEITTFPVQEVAGRMGQAIVFEEDVTERRRLEASLAQSEKLATVGQLAAGVAHEINNPLTAIIANAQLLQRNPGGQEEDWAEMVSLILQAGIRASQVVQQLLDLSRLSRTGPLLTDVNDNLRQAFSLVQHQLRARAVCLEVDLSEGLPVLWANPDQLQSVWLNLLANAIDAVPLEQGEVRVRTRQCGEVVEVLVEDNGMGIPAERLVQIFEPFFSTKDPGRGTGLGLSICQRVVKAHGGEIRVESQPGIGTSFTVLLPVTAPP